jgi:uncharacterized protein (TIRG00374 family)
MDILYKKQIILFFKISVAILIIWYLFRSGMLTGESFRKIFKISNLPIILLSAFIYFIVQMLLTKRLVLLLGAVDFPIRFFKGFRLVMIGNFFNAVIPGMVGGDLVKGYYLLRSEEDKKGRSTGIVIMDRICGLLALVFIGIVSFIYLLGQDNGILYPYRYESYIALLLIGSTFGSFFMLGRSQSVRLKIRKLFAAIFRRSIFYYLIDGFGTLLKNRPILIYSFLISILIQLLSLTGLLILGNILSQDLPDVITLTAVSSIVILFGIIPVTPGNIGWTELIAAFGWSAFGSSAGAEIFLYWRIVTVFCSLPGMVLYVVYSQEWAPAKAPGK